MPPGRKRKPPPADVPPGMDATTHAACLALAGRLDAIMQERGVTPEALAAKSGVSLSTIREIIGARRSSTLSILAPIAAALDLPLAELFGAAVYPQSLPATTIPIRGGARHGAWTSMALDESPRGYAVDVAPLDKRYAAYPRYAIEIEDDSLMGLTPLPILRGYHAVVADLRAAEFQIEPGRVYLVHRTEGGRIQTAFWRAVIVRPGIEFTPLWADAVRNAAETVTVTWDEYDRRETVVIAGILVGSTMRVV